MDFNNLSIKSITKIFECIGYNLGTVTNLRKTNYRVNQAGLKWKDVKKIRTHEVRIHYNKNCQFRAGFENIVAVQLRIMEEHKAYNPDKLAQLYKPFVECTFSYIGYAGFYETRRKSENNPSITNRSYILLANIVNRTFGFKTLSICEFVITKEFLTAIMRIVPKNVTCWNFQQCVFKISEEDLTNLIRTFGVTDICLHGEFTKPIVNDLHLALVKNNFKVFNTSATGSRPWSTFFFREITDITLQNWYYNDTKTVDLISQRTNLTLVGIWNFIKKTCSKANVSDEERTYDFGRIHSISYFDIVTLQRDSNFNWFIPEKTDLETHPHYTIKHADTGFTFKFAVQPVFWKTTKTSALNELAVLREKIEERGRADNPVFPPNYTDLYQRKEELRTQLFDEWTDVHGKI